MTIVVRHPPADMRLARSVGLRLADMSTGRQQVPSSSSSGTVCAAQPDGSRLVETRGATEIDSDVHTRRRRSMPG